MKNLFKYLLIFLFFLISISTNAFEVNFSNPNQDINEAFIDSIKHEHIIEIKENNSSFLFSNLRNERILKCSNSQNNQNSSNNNFNNQNKNNNLAFNLYKEETFQKYTDKRTSQIENTIYTRAP